MENVGIGVRFNVLGKFKLRLNGLLPVLPKRVDGAVVGCASVGRAAESGAASKLGGENAADEFPRLSPYGGITAPALPTAVLSGPMGLSDGMKIELLASIAALRRGKSVSGLPGLNSDSNALEEPTPDENDELPAPGASSALPLSSTSS